MGSIPSAGSKDINMKDKLKRAVKNALSSDKAFDQYNSISKVKEQYVILVNGKRVSVRSGKVVWNGRGPAKSALRNHIQHILWQKKIDYRSFTILDANGDKDYRAVDIATKAAENEWIDKHVVFMPLEKYIAIQKKRSG